MPIFILFFALFLKAEAQTALDPDLEKLFRDSLLFYHTALRDPVSGQYFDSTDIGRPANGSSSVAATGMGLVALALGDATGLIPEARAEYLKTLKFAMGQGFVDEQNYYSNRSKQGWFRHWFDIRTGKDNGGTRVDGFSTIDTAILVAGAQLAANYFEASGKDTDGSVRKIANELLLGVSWNSAVARASSARFYLNFDLANGEASQSSPPFNEYALIPCLGAYAERKKGKSGSMVKLWQTHFLDPNLHPRKSYEGLSLLTDHPSKYISNFTLQFTYYLCRSINTNSDYIKYFKRAAEADRLWFSKQGADPQFWGLGAGSTRFVSGEVGKVNSLYQANRWDNNEYHMVSPHIIAGFLPLYPEGKKDLLALYKNQQCLYTHRDLQVLWRCSFKDPKLPMSRLQAIDFSTMFLGLSTLHPAVGADFYQKYAPGLLYR